MDSLYDLCLKLVIKSVDDNSINCSTIQELPTLLLKDLAPKLSGYGLSRLHRILQGRGIDVQRYWRALCRGWFYQDKPEQRCCSEITDWRQRYLDRSCQRKLQDLEHCKHDDIHQQDIQSREFLEILQNPLSCRLEPLEDFYPSSLSLQSRLLPYIQRNKKTLHILQRNLKELVVSHYLPKYKLILRDILKHLIHLGVLRKFTLKHPKCLTPTELYRILEVCAGGFCHDNKGGGATSDAQMLCKPAGAKLDGSSETNHKDERPSSSVNSRSIQGEGVDNNTAELYQMKETDGDLPASCNSLRESTDGPGSMSTQCKGQPKQVDETDGPDLFDFCFSEPLDAKSVSHPTANLSREGNGLRQCSNRQQQCGRPIEHCIQHLVLYGFMLDQPVYSMMFDKVLSDWPGLRELAFEDNLLTIYSCKGILEALSSSQRNTQSLRRLRIRCNTVHDRNLPRLTDLILNTKIDHLELEATDVESLVISQEALSKLSFLNMCHNVIPDIGVLERALMQPGSVIRHLDLKYCSLDTMMLDRLFISAKDIKCLRELHVGYNKYVTGVHEGNLSPNGRLQPITGLIELLKSSQLTKLDLTSCQFQLRGWTHGQDFVDVLRSNTSLRQLFLGANLLTNECLRLLVSAFICPSPNDSEETPSRCLDLSNNRNVTTVGLRAFSVALRRASSSSHLKIKPHQHLTITIRDNPETAEVCSILDRLLTLTVKDVARWPGEEGRVRTMSYGDFMYEHASQM